ncbi:myelin-oligodendrocyte glycoprotein-like [Centropristis striata]|uniref:myelin-oligodendrocyte glycoprotein-like n=1 Tax=Centropristis striata TaxID=184440 RepID=UPI0027DF62D1|nr:myelin-oligodendrocyte glycoprotein-like [Centropristis striata]XP_059210261.1 myelin-oligodendrocyte glycoprotein-like [Centropristis striata]
MPLLDLFGFWLSVFLCSLPVTTGQSNLICSSQPIVALAGDDVVLPCRLDPPTTATFRAVEWTKPGLDPDYVHVHQDGRLAYQGQNPQFKYRTTLFLDQLINGNVSLKLLRVKVSDAGKYRCFIPSLWKEAFIQVTVGQSHKDFFIASSSGCTASIVLCVLFGVMLVLAVSFIVWKWRQNKSGEQKPYLTFLIMRFSINQTYETTSLTVLYNSAKPQESVTARSSRV